MTYSIAIKLILSLLFNDLPVPDISDTFSSVTFIFNVDSWFSSNDKRGSWLISKLLNVAVHPYPDYDRLFK